MRLAGKQGFADGDGHRPHHARAAHTWATDGPGSEAPRWPVPAPHDSSGRSLRSVPHDPPDVGARPQRGIATTQPDPTCALARLPEGRRRSRAVGGRAATHATTPSAYRRWRRTPRSRRCARNDARAVSSAAACAAALPDRDDEDNAGTGTSAALRPHCSPPQRPRGRRWRAGRAVPLPPRAVRNVVTRSTNGGP